MIVHREFQQKSEAWLQARAGLPTASEFDNLLTPKFKLKEGEGRATYLHKKLCEKWLGGPLAGFSTFAVEQGEILEDQAVGWYELEYNRPIERVGLITTDDGLAGCSPDGLFPDGTGIEIKCPAVHTHCGYLLHGKLPQAYAAQVHGSMFITDAPLWTFLSYARHFPAFVLEVPRDELIQDAIYEAVSTFIVDLDAAYQRLVELNGGEPVRAPKPAAPRQQCPHCLGSGFNCPHCEAGWLPQSVPSVPSVLSEQSDVPH